MLAKLDRPNHRFPVLMTRYAKPAASSPNYLLVHPEAELIVGVLAPNAVRELPSEHLRNSLPSIVWIVNNVRVAETRCERCDLKVGLGCSCSGVQVRRFVPSEILISPKRYAHLPNGCNHTATPDIMESDWGAIRQPRPGLWTSISPGSPAWAESGNLGRYAERRCEDCNGAFPGAN
ncbi:hypothetical protein GCM10009677_41950 [Sphaerisporangium rubeum]